MKYSLKALAVCGSTQYIKVTAPAGHSVNDTPTPGAVIFN